MIEKTPGRRIKPAALRKYAVNTSLTLEQREKFLELGGSGWLQRLLDDMIRKDFEQVSPLDLVRQEGMK